MRYLLIILKSFAAVLVAAAIIFIVGALVPRPFWPVEQNPVTQPRQVLLLSNPIHTDLAFPADPDVLQRLSFLTNDNFQLTDPRIKWIIVGWGGRSFYLETPTWAQLKFMPLMRGISIDNSVMHVEPTGAFDINQPHIEQLSVSGKAFDAMLQNVVTSFQTDNTGNALMIAGAQYGLNDRFFEANGRFSAIVGCNTWTSAILRSGGLRTGFWNPMPQSLVWSLKRYNTF
ncbi:TIGR02117 family protein [Phyllobacterium sp. SB3]|uniref:TIGR02117 family protein n=1 Tax=Phyllobacterium sp. SB3 TaxID=3156073 RepID=UPI0032AF2FB8